MSKYEVPKFPEYVAHQELSGYVQHPEEISEEEFEAMTRRRQYETISEYERQQIQELEGTPYRRAARTLQHVVPEPSEELLSLLDQTPENQARLREADPEVFVNGYPRLVQRDRQPIVFLASERGLLEDLRPYIRSNILEYRGNYYVAPRDSKYQVVRLKGNTTLGNQLSIPALYVREAPGSIRTGEMSRDELIQHSASSRQPNIVPFSQLQSRSETRESLFSGRPQVIPGRQPIPREQVIGQRVIPGRSISPGRQPIPRGRIIGQQIIAEPRQPTSAQTRSTTRQPSSQPRSRL